MIPVSFFQLQKIGLEHLLLFVGQLGNPRSDSLIFPFQSHGILPGEIAGPLEQSSESLCTGGRLLFHPLHPLFAGGDLRREPWRKLRQGGFPASSSSLLTEATERA